MIRQNQSHGFIRLEIIILAAIVIFIGLSVLSAYTGAREQARDQQRLSDVAAMQKALGVFFQENGYYPDGSTAETPNGIANYLDRWPTPPKADGACNASQNTYLYSQLSSGTDYSLTFCLGSKLSGLSAGVHQLTSKGVQ